MNEDVAIKVEGVYKDFYLPHEKHDSLKSTVVNIFKKKDATIETQHALKDISFEIKKGEFFGIVGRNGSGKSTLLKILAQIYQPTKGRVQTEGKLVPFIELGVGFNPELTGRENVYLNGALLGFTKKEVDLMYDDIVDFAEIEKFMDQKLKNYSSGMQVRLAFSVAIKAEGDILILDEVLAVGDAAFQKKCFDYFRNLKKNKKTVVFVSHDMGAVREYCDRAVMIEKSKLVLEGDPEKIGTEYRKMFITEQVDSEDNAEEASKRYGDKAMVFSKPKLTKKRLRDDDQELELKVTVTAKIDIEQPILGFSIKSPTGQSILGMNNKLKKQTLEILKGGDQLDLTWSVPNVFSNGSHYIDLAAEYNGGSLIADRWEESIRFDVDKEEQTRNIVSPSVQLKMKSKSGK